MLRPPIFLSLPLLLGALVLAGCGEDELPTGPTSAPTPEDLTAEVIAGVAFKQVASDGFGSCAVTTDNRAYCWGQEGYGELGNGADGGSAVPVAVVGGHRFRQIAMNSHRTCAISTDNLVWCWGLGPVGDGTTQNRDEPVQITGPLLEVFQLDVGSSQICAVSNPQRLLYCWGGNRSDGTTVLTPTLVEVGRVTWRMVTGGEGHTCALSTTDQAWCWGSNRFGQLGIGEDPRPVTIPIRVAGGHLFRQIDAGFQHTCGVTTTHRVFCWGYGRIGQIGDGKLLLRFTPRRVLGDVLYDRVSAGGGQTCAESTDNRAYCWGSNENGGLGDGTKTLHASPVPVKGGLHFKQVSAGGWHACGVADTGKTYCWGRGSLVGDGTPGDKLLPTLIASP